MSKINQAKKNKYANINKSISRDVKYKANKAYGNLEKVLKNKSLENWKVIVGVVVLVIILIFMCIPKNKEEKIDITRYPKNSFQGNDFLTNVYPIFNDVVVIGDSYSYFLALDVGFDFKVFARPGLKLSELKTSFDSVVNTKEKYAVIFIGPNDLMAQTNIDVFKDCLIKYVNQLRDNKKEVLIATYLKSEYTDEAKKKFVGGITVEEYDNAIQEVCEETKSTYIDAKDINDYHNNIRIESNGMIDQLHFNQEFNIKFINRVYEYLYDMIIKEK